MSDKHSDIITNGMDRRAYNFHMRQMAIRSRNAAKMPGDDIRRNHEHIMALHHQDIADGIMAKYREK